jgi:membrane protein involved in colicin uptake
MQQAHIPELAQDLLRRCLAWEVEQRPSAGELLDHQLFKTSLEEQQGWDATLAAAVAADRAEAAAAKAEEDAARQARREAAARARAEAAAQAKAAP